MKIDAFRKAEFVRPLIHPSSLPGPRRLSPPTSAVVFGHLGQTRRSAL